MVLGTLIIATISFVTIAVTIYYMNRQLNDVKDDVDNANKIASQNKDNLKTLDTSVHGKLEYSENQILDKIASVKKQLINLINNEQSERAKLNGKIVNEENSRQNQVTDIMNSLSAQQRAMLEQDKKFMKRIDDILLGKNVVDSETSFRLETVENKLGKNTGMISELSDTVNKTNKSFSTTVSSLTAKLNTKANSSDLSALSDSFATVNSDYKLMKQDYNKYKTDTSKRIDQVAANANITNVNVKNQVDAVSKRINDTITDINNKFVGVNSSISSQSILTNKIGSDLTNLASWKSTADDRIGQIQSVNSTLLQFKDKTTNDITDIRTNVTKVGNNFDTLSKQQSTIMDMINKEMNVDSSSNAVKAITKLQSDLANNIKTNTVTTNDLNLSGTVDFRGNNVALNEKPLNLRGKQDVTTGVQYDASVDGVRVWGNAGGKLGTANNKSAFSWNADGNASVSGVLDAKGGMKLDGCLELGMSTSDKDGNAGKLCYSSFSDGVDIVGAGKTGETRKVKIWDQLEVRNKINMSTETDGPFIERTWDQKDKGNRYGVGQFPNGTMKVYGAGSYGPTTVSMSMAKADGTFNDILTVNNQNQTVMNGMAKISKALNVGNNSGNDDFTGINNARRDGRWTHFDWKDNGNNYIRGDTIFDDTLQASKINTANGINVNNAAGVMIEKKWGDGDSYGIALNDATTNVFASASHGPARVGLGFRKQDGGFDGRFIVDKNNNYSFNPDRNRYSALGMVVDGSQGDGWMWKNGPGRNDDGGANTMTIRNDNGSLRLMARNGEVRVQEARFVADNQLCINDVCVNKDELRAMRDVINGNRKFNIIMKQNDGRDHYLENGGGASGGDTVIAYGGAYDDGNKQWRMRVR